MKIIINEDENIEDIEIIINCKKSDEHILKMISYLNSFDKKLAGHKDGKTYIINPETILYIDTVDKKTFVYTENNVYETHFKLYELEERLRQFDFFRSSKSSIINISKIDSILPDFGGRLEVVMVSGERLIVSRQYAHNLKNILEK